MTSIRRRPAFEACEDRDSSSGNGIAHRLPRFQSTQAASVERKGRDRIHHSLAQSLIKILAGPVKIVLGEMNRLAYHDRDPTGFRPFLMNRPGVVGAENSHRHDWRERLRDDEAKTGLGRL